MPGLGKIPEVGHISLKRHILKTIHFMIQLNTNHYMYQELTPTTKLNSDFARGPLEPMRAKSTLISDFARGPLEPIQHGWKLHFRYQSFTD